MPQVIIRSWQAATARLQRRFDAGRKLGNFLFIGILYMTPKSTRRDFLTTEVSLAGVATAFTILPRYVLGGPRAVPPSEKLNIAGIGIGGMGGTNMANIARPGSYKHERP
jgi:hypothetical protein